MSGSGCFGGRGWRWLFAIVVLFVLGWWVAGASGQRAAVGGTVVVPRVGSGVVGAYDRLHAAGLRVSVPHGLSFDSLAPPKVGRVVPAAGRRVPRGSVVALYLSRNARRPTVPVGRLRKYVVAKFVGGAVSSAYGWVSRRRLDFRAYLGPLKAGGARGLFANYRVTRQRPVAGVRLTLGHGKRPVKGRGGSFRLTPLTVWGAQPVPARPVAPCTPPPGYTVIASNPQAVITSHPSQETGTPLVGWYGCLRAVGKQRLLTSAVELYDYYYTSAGPILLAGRFAAFQFLSQDHYQNCSSSIDIYDLSTGKPGQVFTADCSYPGPYAYPPVDSLLLNSNGFAAWRATHTYPRIFLEGVSCPSVSLCVATDNVGNLVSTTAPSGGREAWSIANVDGQIEVHSVSCPSPSLCVAVDQHGNVLTSSNPTGGAGAWTVTHVDSISGLYAISCPSTSLCVATDQVGNLLTSTNPTGGAAAWTVTHVAGSSFAGGGVLSCPTASLCVATDVVGNLLTSTNPTGGAAAWTLTHVAGANRITAISCPSTSLCVAGDVGGNLLTSTNPTGGASAWTATKIPTAGDVYDVSCPSTSLCVAGDNSSNLLTSTNPTGGATAWAATKMPTGVAVIGVSCPSTSLCVALGTGGSVLTSTNPAGGSSAWSRALIDSPPACVATQFCLISQLYAYDNQGTRVLDSTSPGAAYSLTNVMLAGNLLTWINNGAPHQTTLR
jgi:hypothetical protein